MSSEKKDYYYISKVQLICILCKPKIYTFLKYKSKPYSLLKSLFTFVYQNYVIGIYSRFITVKHFLELWETEILLFEYPSFSPSPYAN